eukprot:scaffold74923_cov24-Cyclotella_meneghiniana.AAC.3
MKYQPTHGQNGRRQSLLKEIGLSPLHPSLSMPPVTLVQRLKATQAATNASGHRECGVLLVLVRQWLILAGET